MNLVWHIIKKDIRRMAWVFVMWAVTGAYLAGYKNFNVLDRSIWDNLGIVALLTHVALTLALIAAIVHEDGLTTGREFWRTRPIAAGRLLLAKLGLILVCFVGVPVCLFVGLRPHFQPGDLVYVFPIMTVMVLCCMAVASCTKGLGHYFLGGIICLMGGAMLGALLSRWAGPQPTIKVADLARVEMIKTAVFFGWCGIAAGAVLVNQYFTRRTVISLGIAAVAVVGATLISSLWGRLFLG